MGMIPRALAFKFGDKYITLEALRAVRNNCNARGDESAARYFEDVISELEQRNQKEIAYLDLSLNGQMMVDWVETYSNRPA